MKSAACVGYLGALLSPLLWCPPAQAATAEDELASGHWTVARTTRLPHLSIPTGARIDAAADKSLTMTVGGVETPLAPGSYDDVVLTLTDLIPEKSASVAPHDFRTALYVDDGRVVADKSVAAARRGGQVTNTRARHVSVRSVGNEFNAIMVSGNSHYTLDSPDIDLTGNGGDVTDGFGAGIWTGGKADVTINHPHIRTHGAIREAIFVGGDSTVHVNDADIEVRNGTLPAGYVPNIGDGRIMMEVPWMLGISGNVRATNAGEHGTVYYKRSHIRAQAWGALSTDGVEHVRMDVKDSHIETIQSGYGAYALGDTVEHFSHCVFDVADYGVIIAGGATAEFTDGTVVKSRKYGAMMHSGSGSALTIDKGSHFESRSTLIESKGSGVTIQVDDATLVAGNGVILQTMDNDDPFMKAMAARHPRAQGAMPGEPAAKVHHSNNVVARFARVQLDGDLLHAMSDLGELDVTLQAGATLTGAISDSVASPASGQEPTQATYYSIGAVKNELGFGSGPHGLHLSLESGSHWIVRRTSYLDHLSIQDGAQIVSTEGRRVSLNVDGVDQALSAGTYDGHIIVRVGAGTPVARKVSRAPHPQRPVANATFLVVH